MAFLLLRTASALMARLPRSLAYLLATAAALAWWPLMGERRRALRQNLRHVMPGAPDRVIDGMARRNVRLYALAFADFLRLRRWNTEDLARRLQVRGAEHAAGVLERREGALVVSVHMGSWEVVAAAWSRIRPGTVSLVTEVLGDARLERWYVETRKRMGINVIPLRPTSLRTIHRVLRQGHVVGLALDRDILGTGRPATFFGEPASIPCGVMELAHEAGLPVLPVFLVRDGDGYAASVWPSITPDATLDRDADAARMTEQFLRCAEVEIRRHPDQWHVLQPIWKGWQGVAVPGEVEEMAAVGAATRG
jgi:KDO2-lipid IV(A) lauroyltransferase